MITQVERLSPRAWFWLLLALAAVLLLGSIRAGDLSGYDDAFYAHEGKELLRHGQWLDIQIDGEPNLEYPPLFVWMEAASMALFGYSDYAAKLPAALCGLGTIALTGLIAQRLFTQRWWPIVAMVTLLTTQYFIKYSTHAMTDVPFTFLFALAVWCLLKVEERAVWWVGLGVAIGLAQLMRPIVGALIVLTVAGFVLGSGRARSARSWWVLAGLICAFAPILAWYGHMVALYGDHFWEVHFRFVGGKVQTSARHWTDLLGYAWLIGKLYWPWLPFLLAGAVFQLRRGRKDPAVLLLWWAGVVVGVLSLAEAKVLRYVLPAFPAFSLLATVGLGQWLGERKVQRGLAWLLIPLVLGTVGLAIVPQAKERARDMRVIAAVVDRAVEPQGEVVLFTQGDPHWESRNQLIWYSHAYAKLVTSRPELEARLASGGTFVLDRGSFAEYVRAKSLPGQTIGESENFVCWRAGRR